MTFHKQIQRRDFIRGIGALGVVAATLPAQALAAPFSFLHGVASGDPLADRVVLWTRVTTRPASPPRTVAAANSARSWMGNDFTVRLREPPFLFL